MNKIYNRPVHLLFSGHDFKFIQPLVERCRQSERYEVRLDEHRSHEINSEKDCQRFSEWADIIFCEWAMGNAVWYSNHKRPGQLLIVRLHLQEVQARNQIRFIYDTDWEKVDKLILICHHMQDFMVNEFPVLRTGRACLIYNPIDALGALNRPKMPGAEFNLGLVGIVPQRKRMDIAIEILKRLKERDSRYTLYIKGHRPEEYAWMRTRTEEMAWYHAIYRDIESLPYANSIIFDPQGTNMPLWYSKIGFILSPSDFEGSHQAVAEGMAAGCIPVIRDWEGADRLYPPQYVFRTPDEAAAAIGKWKTPELYQDQMDFCRAYAQENFDQRGICDRIEAFFAAHLGWPQPVVAGKPTPLTPALSTPPVLMLAYIPAGYRGGYRIRVEQEIQTLARQQVKIHLACLHPEADAAALERHRRELAALGCTVHMVPVRNFFDIKLDEKTVDETLDALQRIVRDNGLKIAHVEALYTMRLATMLKRRSPDLRLIFDCHGTSPEEERMGGAHPARVAAMEDWEKKVLAGADLNVFVSEAMSAYYLKKYGFKTLPHILVPCCVADERFPNPNVNPPRLEGLPTGRPVIVYLGTMAAWQCGQEMIRLFAQLQRYDPQFFFLLLAPEGDHAQTREWIERYGLPASSVLLTELAHDQVAACLRQAHAGVLLRRRDPVNEVSSPTKFGEYLAAGLPVIMTEGIGDFSAAAADSGLGLVLDPALLDREECPPQEIARIAAFVRESVDGRRQVAARCTLAAREQLHWDVASARLVKQYRTLAEQPTKR